MAMLRVDHIAIAVRDLDAAVDRYVQGLGAEQIARKKGVENGEPVEVAYLRLGESVVTLISSDKPDGFVNRFIEKRGEGLHHLALETDDLDGTVANLERLGLGIPLRADLYGRREVILRPREFAGVVLQIIQWDRPAATIEERAARIRDFELKPAGES